MAEAVKKLKLGLPKGSLQESTFKMFKKAGFNISVGSRSYFPYIDDDEIEAVLIRAQEMSRYVEDGALDCGITGEDWIQENGSDVVRIQELVYAKTGNNPVRWVLAVPNASNIQSSKDLQGKRIATELKGFTEKYLQSKGVTADVEFSWGATEVKVASGLVDAIVELTETGSSLKANNLRIVETLCHSTTQFITNKKAWADPKKKQKMEHIALLLQGALNAESKVGLKMNVAQSNLQKILSLLPAMKNPTVANLATAGWVDVDTIIDEKIVRVLIPKLKEAGAEGIIENPLNKVIY
ncbi:MAG TPA: ATP phosphoribosyltransferase [Candidatus Eisenbacteria bacterium]|nr:ATP phosphoribosyltransferase [Candidatus Eisenbacteria bacterium]